MKILTAILSTVSAVGSSYVLYKALVKPTNNNPSMGSFASCLTKEKTESSKQVVGNKRGGVGKYKKHKMTEEDDSPQLNHKSNSNNKGKETDDSESSSSDDQSTTTTTNDKNGHQSESSDGGPPMESQEKDEMKTSPLETSISPLLSETKERPTAEESTHETKEKLVEFTVTFQVPIQQSKDVGVRFVRVAGTFSDWKLVPMYPMGPTKNGPTSDYQATLMVHKNVRHEFKFVLNDEQWLTSPEFETCSNRLGGLNNCITF